MTPPKKEDANDIWNSNLSNNHAYWDRYLAIRPKYHTSGFYDHVFEYHRSHKNDRSTSSTETVAHDVGCGPGQVTAELAQHFSRVHASDLASSSRLAAALATGTFPSGAPSTHVTFTRLNAQDLAAQFPAASADFLAAAECISLMDADAALAAWAAVLRPGGTLALWFYGKPHFVPGDGYDAASCQRLYDSIATRKFGSVYRGINAPQGRAAFERGTRYMASFLDEVRVPEEAWTDVRRWKWNADLEMLFFGPEAVDIEIRTTDRVGPAEKVEEVRDLEFWGESWTAADWRWFLKMNFPPADEKAEESEEVDAQWRELADAMGGEDVKRKTAWPVCAILATRK